MEDKLDEEISALDRLDLDDLEVLKERRLQQMKKMADKRSRWISLGHGEYTKIFSEKDFFSTVKASDRVVCHFYSENWPCKVLFLIFIYLFILTLASHREDFQLRSIDLTIQTRATPNLCSTQSTWIMEMGTRMVAVVSVKTASAWASMMVFSARRSGASATD
ncbi:thioredoxin domain-containing protein 9 like protein [Quercus suber]|uniref:Thioredoxin domain-containing protein 9 like protein n=1 Tax=Quercus suber TaxID=58331 RepID=A0AAW0KSI7_QUESU